MGKEMSCTFKKVEKRVKAVQMMKLEKFDNGTKIQKAYKTLVVVVVSCERISPSGTWLTHMTQMTQISKKDPVQGPGAQIYFPASVSA